MICLFGGTFDPVHRGHLHAALSVCEALGIDEIRLILSARPSHRKTPGATISQRWDMLCLACASDPRLRPDDREIRRARPSFTVDTLAELRAEHPREPLVWVIGSDAYALLPSWYRWQRVLELCHLLVLNRPGHALDLDDTMRRFTAAAMVTDAAGARVAKSRPAYWCWSGRWSRFLPRASGRSLRRVATRIICSRWRWPLILEPTHFMEAETDLKRSIL